MFTFKISEFVPAGSIWPTAKSYKDKGNIPGYVRGYNIEVTNSRGVTDWMGAHFFEGDPEEHFNGDFEMWHREAWCLVPTGRITFRGYYTAYWYAEERDWCVEKADGVNEEV